MAPWGCVACTFLNEESAVACAICMSPKGQAASADHVALEESLRASLPPPTSTLQPVPFQPSTTTPAQPVPSQPSTATPARPLPVAPSAFTDPPSLIRMESWGNAGADKADDEEGGEGDVDDDDDELWADAEVDTEINPRAAPAKTEFENSIAHLYQDATELADVPGHFAGLQVTNETDVRGQTSQRIRVHVGFLLNTAGVSPEQARVWHMDLAKPLVITCDFGADGATYLSTPPRVSMCQASGRGDWCLAHTELADVSKCGLIWLIVNRIKTDFLRTSFSSKALESRKSPRPAVEVKAARAVQMMFARVRLKEKTGEVIEVTGVAWPLALGALLQAKENPDVAVQLLLDPKRKAKLEQELEQCATGKDAEANGGKARNDDEQAPKRSRLFGFLRGKPVSRRLSVAEADTELQMLSLVDHNFLVRLVNFVKSTMLASGSHCMMCWTSLSFSGFKPTVCDKAMCLFKSQELGVGVSVLAEMQAAPAVTDLLVSLAYAAVAEHRIEWLFPKEVLVVHRDFKSGKSKEYSFMKDGVKRVDRVQEVLDKLPQIDSLLRYASEGALKTALDKRHRLCYPLLQWLIASNRSHVRVLARTDEHYCEHGPKHQFVLLTSDPAREKHFRRRKKEMEAKLGKGKGSILLTHGSGLGNWHVILRTGLKTSKSNMDQDTKVGRKGATGICEGGAIGASGGAIWMAMQPAVSMGYTKLGTGWPKSRFGQQVVCMAVCEVINDESKRVVSGSVSGGSHVEGPHEYVCTEVRDIAPRYLWLGSALKAPSVQAWDGHSTTGPGTVTHMIGFPKSLSL